MKADCGLRMGSILLNLFLNLSPWARGRRLPMTTRLSNPIWLTSLRALAALLLLSGAVGAAETDVAKGNPNVVLILADDLGWMDLASYAARVRGVERSECFYETPNLDRFADQGMSFSQAYACHLCSPARASVLTGQYAARHGFLTASGHTSGSYYTRKTKPAEGYHIHDRKEGTAAQTNPALGYIAPSFTYALQSGQNADLTDALTIPEALNGYRSAMAGKWHLGALGVEGYQPQDQGFDDVLAYRDHGGSHYFNWRKDWQEPGADLGIEYLTDDLTERAVRFMRDCAESPEPFFLYLPHFAVHAPREAKQTDIDHFAKKANRGWNGHSSPEYAGVIRGLDDSVGGILDALDDLGIADNTLFIFMSDNGGIDRPEVTSNAPLRGGKAAKYEGGIRVPLIVRWPGRTTAGSICDVPVDCNDIFPTILSAVGQAADLKSLTLDGQSLLPLFDDPSNRSDQYSRESFFWHSAGGGLDKKGKYSPAHSAMRRGNYKLLFDHQGYLELYDLSKDISEEHDLSAQMPEKTRQLFSELINWLEATVPERYVQRPNLLYSPEANAASDAPPYRDLRRELLGMGDGDSPSPVQPSQKDDSLVNLFVNPPGAYRSTVLWEWCNGWLSKEGATAELESMARVGLGGAKVFNVGGPEGEVRFASPEWYEIFAHALREASRLDLQLAMNMTEGFCAIGGPWITPEKSMQYVVWSETEVTGPGAISIAVEKPDDGPIEATTLKLKDVGYYKDYRVLAVPQVAADQIKSLEIKKGMRGHHDKNEAALQKTKVSSVKAADIVPLGKVIDLTDKMDANGRLNWTAPAGKWTILRMGSASTGACTRPGNEKTRGLEADKFSREAVKLHFDSLCKPLLEMDGVKPGENLTYFAVDSWEADGQNWSPVLPAEFEKRRGYSLYPFMPVLTGRIVESVEVSERFLYDFRRTLADCAHDNFFGYLVELCAEYNMKFGSEPFSRAAFDGMEIVEAIGHPTATFWNSNSPGRAYKEGKWAASAAHVLGDKKVTSEAFPAGKWEAAWVHYPWTYKWHADYAYAAGVNHMSFHCTPFQPWDDKAVHKPGMVFKNWGSQYSRHNTWWEQGVDWHKYQARCQFMLQQGMFQAEALFMTPEVVPGLELVTRPSLPLGYDFDLVSAKLVRDQLFARDGMVCAPSGMKYHMLCLPKIDEISVPLLKKIQKLVADGAHVVVSGKPQTSLGLNNYPASKEEVSDIVAEVWQNLDGEKAPEVSYGKGKLYWTTTPHEVLEKLEVEPDVIVEAEGETEEQSSYRAKLPITYIHRATPEADFFFVASSSEKTASGLLSFRISGKQPEFWYPDTGRIEKCAVYEVREGRTIIPMIFDPAAACFVVFREEAKGAPVTQVSLNGTVALSTSKRINPLADTKNFFKAGGTLKIETADGESIEQEIEPNKVRSLDSDWMVSFDGVGAPKAREFDKLMPWNESSDELLRYFSGTGIYRKTIEVKKKKGEQFWLDLGSVEVIATVVVNGKEAEIEWKPPFLTNITDALESGRNELEIRVSNLWGNRFIGDEQYPDDIGFASGRLLSELPKWFVENTPRPQQGRKTFTTSRYYDKDDPLRPSGLLGPVSLITRSKSANPLVEQIASDLFVFSRNPDFLSYGWHRKAPYFKEIVKKPKKKAASPVKHTPGARPEPVGKNELRRWAVGKHQENTGSYVRTFVNSKQKQLVTLRSADGKEFNISHRSLTPEDLAYLESIQAKVKE